MINVVCNIDRNYVKYCTVMLVSLLENNKNNRLLIHIIGNSLAKGDKDIIKEETSRYNCSIVFYDMNDEFLKKCPIRDGSYISVTTYFRIFLETILPKSLEKVIYLDCDLIVRKDISELWNTDIDNYAIACVEDTCSNVQGLYNPHIRLGYDKKYSYFNAGVLLFNLKYCRENKIEERCINFIEANVNCPDKLIYYDQDVLNAVLYNQKKYISFKWNMQEGFYRRKRQIREDVWPEIERYLKDPAILHFLGKRKPWHSKASYPLRNDWFRYLDKTRWKGSRPNFNYWFKFLRFLNKFGVLLKIDKPRYRNIN